MTTKFHLAITADNHIVEGFLSGGNTSDITVADELTQNVYDCHVLEDMGYDSDRHRIKLRANNNIPVIPGRKNRKEVIKYDKPLYKLRRRVEMYFGKLKENRRIATRYDKSDSIFLNFIILAAIKMIIC